MIIFDKIIAFTGMLSTFALFTYVMQGVYHVLQF